VVGAHSLFQCPLLTIVFFSHLLQAVQSFSQQQTLSHTPSFQFAVYLVILLRGVYTLYTLPQNVYLFHFNSLVKSANF